MVNNFLCKVVESFKSISKFTNLLDFIVEEKNMENIPENIIKDLKEMEKKSGMKIEKLKAVFEKFYDALQKDPAFLSGDGELIEDELYDYIILRMRGMYTIRQPVKTHDIIPIGMDQVRLTKKKSRRSSLFVIDRKKELRQISFMGDACDLLSEISLYYKYNDVPLVEMNSGDLMADDRTSFDDFKETQLVDNPESVVQLSGAKKIVINDLYNASERKLKETLLSTKDKNNWTVQTDWRAIYGQTVRVRQGTNEDEGTNWASFRIIDKSIPHDEIINENGDVIQPGIMVYTSPHVINDLPDGSKVWVLGPMNQSEKTKAFSMNGFCVISVFEPTI